MKATVVAFMRFAGARCSSGCTVWSFLATMNQLGFDFQAISWRFCWLEQIRDEGVNDHEGGALEAPSIFFPATSRARSYHAWRASSCRKLRAVELPQPPSIPRAASCGSPVPRMGRPPDPDPLHMYRPTEVVLVLRLLSPASLSGFEQYFCRPRLRTSTAKISPRDRHMVLLLFAMAPPKGSPHFCFQK
jgi:hypothetical protein